MKSLFQKLLLLSTIFFTSLLYADEATVGVTISNATVNESAGKITFTVTVDELPLSLLAPVRVDYITLDGTAKDTIDYIGKTSNIFTAVWFLSISPSTSKTIEVDIIDDAIYDTTKSFYTKISTTTTGYGVIDDTATGTIIDDDVAPLSLYLHNQTIMESDDNNSKVSFTARLNQDAPSGGVTLTYETSDNTALAGEDYVSKSGSITIPEGSIDGFIEVDIIGDLISENSESFNLKILTISTGTLDKGEAITTIYDNDAIKIDLDSSDVQEGNSGDTNKMEFRIFLDKAYPSATPLTIDYQTEDGSSPSATAGLDYTATSGSVTFNQGDTEQFIYVDIIADDEIEDDEHVKLAISGSSYIIDFDSEALILNDDGSYPIISFDSSDFSIIEGDSGQKMLEFNLTLSEPAMEGASFHYATSNREAEEESTDNDYINTSGDYTLDVNITTISIAVPINGDTNIEPDESFNFRISNVVNLNVSGTDRAKGHIINDDGSYPTLSFESSTLTIVEGDSGEKNATFTLVLDQPAVADSSFEYRTLDDTAKWAGDDYNNTFGTYNIALGDTNISINVPINGDNNEEPDEIFTFEVFNPQNILLVTSTIVATVTIENDDVYKKFSCDTDAYIFGSTAYNTQTDAYGFDLSDGTEISKNLDIHPSNINAIGYNTTDNYIWGYDRDNYKVVHVNNQYEVISHEIAGLPTFSPTDDTTPTYHVGDVSMGGIFHLFTISDKSTIYRVDVNDKSVNYLTNLSSITLSSPLSISDFAFSPIDNLLYAVDYNESLIRIDQNSGQVTNLGPLTMPSTGNVVSVFFDVDGNLYTHHTDPIANTGNIYKIIPPQDAQASITATYFSAIGATTHGDGARCPLASITPPDEEPFICDDSMYISSSVNRANPTSSGKMWLHKIDTEQNPFEFIVIDTEGSSQLYNALAYADGGDANTSNYIFGLYFKELVKLTKTGKVISLGDVVGLPDFLDSKQLFAGAIYGDQYYVSGPGQDYDKIFKINLADKAVTEITLDTAISLLDFSFSSDGQFLHGIVDGGKLVKISVTTGDVEFIGDAHTGYQFDSTFSDAKERFFANDSLGNGFFEFDLKNGKKHFLSASQKAEFNDGANCLNAELSFMDYGDAPISYGKTWHSIANDIYLGENVDHDIADFDTIDADGDDKNGIDDEDGVLWADGSDINGSYFEPNQTHELNVTLSKEGYLKIWIDIDINGHFSDAADLVYNSGVALSTGTHTINFTLPDGLEIDKITYLRARVSSNSNLNPVGYVTDGEVEDYAMIFGTEVKPLKGAFNIERTDSENFTINSNERDAWYTQVVGRDFHYSVVFYEENLSAVQETQDLTFKVELYNNESNTSIAEMAPYYGHFSELSPRYRLPIGDINDLNKLSAYRDVEFRISYAIDTNNSIVQEPCPDGNYKLCFNSLAALYNIKTQPARDNFSIRPRYFYTQINDINNSTIKTYEDTQDLKLAAGYNYNLSVKATTYDEKTSLEGYSTLKLNRTTKFNDDGIHCADTSSDSNIESILNGVANINFSFKEVGKYILEYEDNSWTEVDSNKSTPQCNKNNSSISPEYSNELSGCNITAKDDLNISFQPYQFDLSQVHFNVLPIDEDDALYMSKITPSHNNVAVQLQGDIIAQNAKGVQTTNFTKECAAKDVSLTLGADIRSDSGINTPLQTTADNNSSRLPVSIVQYFNGVISHTNNINNNITLSKAEFLDDNLSISGLVSIDLRYNISKNLSRTINPVEINFKRLLAKSSLAESSITANTKHLPTGLSILNKVRYFYFTQVAPNTVKYPRVNYQGSPIDVRTPLSVDIFCNESNAFCDSMKIFDNANTQGSPRIQQGWYISSNHNRNLDGNVSILSTVSPSITIAPATNIPFTNGHNNGIVTTVMNAHTLINRVEISLPLQLRYRSPYYELPVIDNPPSEWTGIGKTGNIIETEPNTNGSNKMNW